MAGKARDLTGRKYGQWTVEARDPNPVSSNRHVYWLVVCTCGTETSVRATDLMTGISYRCKECSYSSMRKDSPA